MRKLILTKEVRKDIYNKTVDRSVMWASMTLEEMKAEWLALGNTPALTTDDRDSALRHLYLAQMRRMI